MPIAATFNAPAPQPSTGSTPSSSAVAIFFTSLWVNVENIETWAARRVDSAALHVYLRPGRWQTPDTITISRPPVRFDRCGLSPRRRSAPAAPSSTSHATTGGLAATRRRWRSLRALYGSCCPFRAELPGPTTLYRPTPISRPASACDAGGPRRRRPQSVSFLSDDAQRATQRIPAGRSSRKRASPRRVGDRYWTRRACGTFPLPMGFSQAPTVTEPW